MQKVIVLIFTHKAEPSADELRSLRQCCIVLGKHPMRLVCPRGMDLAAYRAVHPGIVADFIDPKWFKSVGDYNLLKALPWLYRRYAGYEFMLTYELDAWVFRDELLHWCEQGWDYIGAPWFERHGACSEEAKPIRGGNSGFSLRRTLACLAALRALLCRRVLALPKTWFRLIRGGGSVSLPASAAELFRPFAGMIPAEDFFWCYTVPKVYPFFRIAPYEQCRKFAFETNARRLYEESGQLLPFGCHKWSADRAFWKRFICTPS